MAVLVLGFSARLFAAEAAGGEADRNVAADIAGRKVTFQELDDYLRKTNNRATQEFYDARHAALEALIADRLLEAEAAEKGVTPDKLREQIIASVAVTDADVKTFYDENTARMGGRTLDQIRDQIRTFLAGQKQQQAISDFLGVLREKKGVQVYLEPPRAEVGIAENDPMQGPKGAPIQIVEFSDFQ